MVLITLEVLLVKLRFLFEKDAPEECIAALSRLGTMTDLETSMLSKRKSKQNLRSYHQLLMHYTKLFCEATASV